jgi:hypothetical protein
VRVCVCVCLCVGVFVCVCVFSLSYPACNVHAPNCHLWPAGSTVFFHIISQMARFSKKKCILKTKFVFRLSLQLLSETFLIPRRTERDMIKMYIGLQVQYPS